jgi:tetraacyldisaccharide 4'-kinase
VTSAPKFWWRPRRSGAALALLPLARLWGLSATVRMGRTPRFRPPIAVVCVGNFVVGGAGKTPTALAIGRIARERGLRPGFLASGYGGSIHAPLIVDPARHGAGTVGDEPLLLAAAGPTAVGRDRAGAARLLVGEAIDLIVMDDGFQNPYLAKDLSIVCVDAEAGIGNGMVIPAGPLRAPFAVQLRRADVLLVIGEGKAAEPLIRAAARSGKPVLRAALRPAAVPGWRQDPVLAYAGIGRPEKFFAALADAGAIVMRSVPFPDHHRFSETEATELLSRAEAEGLRLVTTEKDLARLAGAKGTALVRLRERSSAFPVVLVFENPAAVGEMVAEAMRRHR